MRSQGLVKTGPGLVSIEVAFVRTGPGLDKSLPDLENPWQSLNSQNKLYELLFYQAFCVICKEFICSKAGALTK